MKLEASLDDFLSAVEDGFSVTVMDSTLTSREILDSLLKRSVDCPALEEVRLDKMLTNVEEDDLLYRVRHGSGG